MDIEYCEEVFPFIIINNTYDEWELELIWEELNFLCYYEKLETDPYKSGTATSEDNIPLKKNRCIWLDTLYKERDYSNILRVNRKLLCDRAKTIKQHPSWFFKSFDCDKDTTLVSYYENSDYYEKHSDSASATVLTWFYKEPKKFSGGDIHLHYEDLDIKVECVNNRTLIFPSAIKHSVDKIEMSEEDCGKKYGRICITQFLTFK